MLRVGALCLCLVCLLTVFIAPVRASGEEAKVSFERGYWTFEEIATRLSTPTETVVCDKTLFNRAALIALKERPRSEVRSLLETGLDIQFVPDPNNPKQVLMEPRAEVKRRETAWRHALADRLTALMKDAIQKRLPALDEPSPTPEEDVAAQQAVYVLNQAIQTETDPKLKESLTQQFQKADAVLEKPHASDRLAYLFLEKASLPIEDVFAEGILTGDVPAVSLSPSLTTAILEESMAWEKSQKVTAAPHVANKVRFYHQRTLWIDFGRLDLQCIFYCQEDDNAIRFFGRGTSLSATIVSRDHKDGLLAAVVYGKGPKASEVGLGKSARTWLEESKEATTTALALPAVTKTLPPNTPNWPPKTQEVSQYVMAWSTATEQEAVMELYPIGEAIISPLKDTSSLAKLLTERELKDRWELRVQDDVFLVKNRWAFLERVRNVPTVAFVKAERTLPPGKQIKLGELLPLSLCEAFLPDAVTFTMARKSGTTRPGSWFGNHRTEYHGIAAYGLEPGLPVLYALSLLKTPDLWEKIPDDGTELTLPFTDIDRATFRTLTALTRVPQGELLDIKGIVPLWQRASLHLRRDTEQSPPTTKSPKPIVYEAWITFPGPLGEEMIGNFAFTRPEE